MPDKNKLRAMAEHGYEIVDSCMTCSFGPQSVTYGNAWGQCSKLRYNHTKHSAGSMPLPTHAAFKCGEHRRAPWVDLNLGTYAKQPWLKLLCSECGEEKPLENSTLCKACYVDGVY
jgi:hypothetical protein